MLLQANNLSCVREDRTLFEHLSFAVRAGDLMQIEGPNGVGKTSLLRLLTGLSQPFAGEVCWNGENIRHCRDEYHASLLYLGHQPGVKATLTPLENLSFYQKLHGPAGDGVDLWRVLAGQAEGRQRADQVTVFDSVGFALEDFSTLRLVAARAEALGLGETIELVPSADDPKDLFRRTRRGRARQAGA